MEELENDALCICGHELHEHHRSWLWGGHLLLEECEYYGSNETGGAMQNDDGQWVDHCQRFTLDREANHGQTRTGSEN